MPSSSDDPELDVSGIFPDPDMVGTSEYFAVPT
jgi:hypothetical protein